MGDTPSKEENSRVTFILKRENTTTEYHTDGTKTQHKKVEYCNFSAPDPETFRNDIMKNANVKAIGYH